MPRNTTDAKAEKDLVDKIKKCLSKGLGCLFCMKGTCLQQFNTNVSDVMRLRRNLRGLDRSQMEYQLLLMFADGERNRLDARVQTEAVEHFDTSDDADPDDKAVEQLRTSDDEAEHFPTSASDVEPLTKKRRAERPRRKEFGCTLLNLPVCRKALFTLVGISKQTIGRIQQGGVDLRREGRKHRLRKDAVLDNVLEFFWEMYHSCAEGLPNKLKFRKTDAGVTVTTKEDHVRERRKTRGASADYSSDEDTKACTANNSSDEERMVHGAALYLSQQRGIDDVLRSGQGVPRRYLHPGRPIHLWWQYVQAAQNKGQRVASYSSFMRGFNIAFKETGFLKFRKNQGDHAKCTACEGLKKELKACKDVQARVQLVQDYSPTMNATRDLEQSATSFECQAQQQLTRRGKRRETDCWGLLWAAREAES